MSRHSFPKEENLKSRKLIGEIFESGSAIKQYPVIAHYIITENDITLSAGFTVSKRNFKRAVDRNRIKRLMREAYRLNKSPIVQSLKQRELHAALMFVYAGKDMPDFSSIEQKIIGIFNRFSKETSELNK
jgi:ribonuclease P protein component